MPPTSAAQSAAMHAAAAGNSTLGIPKAVGEEFVGVDGAPVAAGVLYVDPKGRVLLLHRADDEANYAGHWALPGGKAEPGEDATACAAREVLEEMGDQVPTAPLRRLDARTTPTGMEFHTFAAPVAAPFQPRLNGEHVGYTWASLRALPRPLHPGVAQTLGERLGVAEDMTGEQWGQLAGGLLRWLQEEAAEPEHAGDGFEEGKHPRDDDGKFGSGGGSGKNEHVAQFIGEDPYKNSLGINSALRAGKGLTPEQQELVGHVEQAIQEAPPLEQDTVVWRGIPNGNWTPDGKADPAFTSVSLDRAVAEEFATATSEDGKGTIIRMVLPKGTRALATAPHQDEGMQYQNELLLPRGVALKKNAKLGGGKISDDLAIQHVNFVPPKSKAKDAAPALVTAPSAAAPPLARRAEDAVALDSASVRSVDADGRLHVAVSNISKANVCPYRGAEIPGWEALGLDPDRTYRLYRHPEELAKAAPTFNNLPILSEHIPVSATEHPKELVIGSLGTDAEWAAPWLRNSLVFWTQDAIDDIEAEDKQELSSAYRYTPDMTPGTAPDGARYDGVMRDIIGNHVALVAAGRAGPDVVVGDSAPPQEDHDMKTQPITLVGALAYGALMSHLKPMLAKDTAMPDLRPAVRGLTSANFKGRKKAIAAFCANATAGKLAADAMPDVPGMLDAMEPATEQKELGEPPPAVVEPPNAETTEDGALETVKGLLAGKVDDATMQAVCQALSGGTGDTEEPPPFLKEDKPVMDTPPPTPGTPTVGGGMVTKKAMDAAIAASAKVAADSAREQTMALMRAIRTAEDEVHPYVGKLAIAMDSAEDVYRFCLEQKGVTELDTVPPEAYRAMVRMLPPPGRPAATGTRPHLAADASGGSGFQERFPMAGRSGRRAAG